MQGLLLSFLFLKEQIKGIIIIKNFIMCGDHRAQTSDKLVMWKAANKIDYCKEQQRICHSQC